jgi:hypothetical protein
VQHQEEPAVCLLALPDFLLDSIIGHLALASDVCSVAAACTSLRQLCRTTRLPGVKSFVVDRWTPGLSASLHWAASWCVELQQLDLSGATACSDADLLPLTELSTLTSLQLGGLWRFQVRRCCGKSHFPKIYGDLWGALSACLCPHLLCSCTVLAPICRGLQGLVLLVEAAVPRWRCCQPSSEPTATCCLWTSAEPQCRSVPPWQQRSRRCQAAVLPKANQLLVCVIYGWRVVGEQEAGV